MEKYIEEFDLSTLKEFSNNDTEIMAETLVVLEETLIEDVENMAIHLNNLNGLKLKSIAHKIKPNFLLIGLDSLYNICHNIEKEELTDDNLADQVNIIINSLPKVLQKIKTEKN